MDNPTRDTDLPKAQIISDKNFRALAISGLAGALLSVFVAVPAAADCTAYDAGIEAALARGDHAGLSAAYDNVDACDDAVHRQAEGRHVAAHLFNLAIAGGRAPDEPMLNEVVHYGALWQALASLGDLAQDRGEYAAASARYQDALAQIDDENETPTAPPAEMIKLVRHKAEEAALLSSTFVPALHRGPDNKGLAARFIRGVKVVQVQLPVQFIFGTAQFTPDGRRAAEDMASIIGRDNPPDNKIVLIGHTDHVGTDAVNNPLSLRRAQTVAQYLREHGVAGIPVETEGRGSRDPYPDLNPESHSQEQKDQLDRRVELVRQ